MRKSIAFAVLALAACDQNRGESKGTSGETQTSQPQQPPVGPKPIVKKPVDTRPLPTLEKDPGGATGKLTAGVAWGGLGVDAVKNMARAKDGSLYVVGYFDGEMDAGPAGKLKATEADPPKDPKKKMVVTSDAFLVKVGADNKIAWAKRWGSKRDDVALGVAVQGDQVAVVGNFLDDLSIGKLQARAANSDDAYVVVFDKDGNEQWLYTAGGIDSDGANAVIAAGDGGWFVGGSFMKTASFDPSQTEYKAKGGTDAFMLKLDKGGHFEWVKTFGGNYNDTILHMAMDPRGSIYVQGHFKDKSDWGGGQLVAGGGSDNDVVLAKYDINGEHKWSKRFGNAFNDVAGGLTVDPAGNVTMVGSFDKSVSFGEGDDHVSKGEADIFIARFDTDGKLKWAKTYGGDREDVGWGIASDAAGNTVMTGWFQNTIDWGVTTLGTTKSAGNKDVVAIKHDTDGNIVWVKTWGDKDHDQGRAVVLDDKGNPIVAGIFRFTLSAVTPPLESVRAPDDRIPKPDAFVVRMER